MRALLAIGGVAALALSCGSDVAVEFPGDSELSGPGGGPTAAAATASSGPGGAHGSGGSSGGGALPIPACGVPSYAAPVWACVVPAASAPFGAGPIDIDTPAKVLGYGSGTLGPCMAPDDGRALAVPARLPDGGSAAAAGGTALTIELSVDSAIWFVSLRLPGLGSQPVAVDSEVQLTIASSTDEAGNNFGSVQLHQDKQMFVFVGENDAGPFHVGPGTMGCEPSADCAAVAVPMILKTNDGETAISAGSTATLGGLAFTSAWMTVAAGHEVCPTIPRFAFGGGRSIPMSL